MGWDSWEKASEAGPGTLILKIILWMVGLTVLLTLIGLPLGFFQNAAKTVHQEFAPSVLLEKYEWFKDASASLDEKQASIKVYERRIEDLETTYKGVPRASWPRDDREQESIWRSEVAGVTASYNQLAATYNSAMSKFNWRFTNAGDLPAGASAPLPRAYKPYAER